MAPAKDPSPAANCCSTGRLVNVSSLRAVKAFPPTRKDVSWGSERCSQETLAQAASPTRNSSSAGSSSSRSKFVCGSEREPNESCFNAEHSAGERRGGVTCDGESDAAGKRVGEELQRLEMHAA